MTICGIHLEYPSQAHRIGTQQTFSSACVWSQQKLPEQAYLHPPLTLFVEDRRAFGRLALVGIHVVQSLMDYAPPELGEEPDEEEEDPTPKYKSKEKGVVFVLTR